MKQYRTIAKISDTVGSPAFNRRLVQQGLLKQENGQLTPTGFGLLLFGREPRTVMPQAGLLGTIHFADGTEEPKDFDGPQVLAPEQALQWLRDKLPNPIERSAARRRQANEALFELVREGVVNALVHRDYAIGGAKCQLIATPDTITVKSPGKPVEPITLLQMQSFTVHAEPQPAFAMPSPEWSCRRAGTGAEVHEDACGSGWTTASQVRVGGPLSGAYAVSHGGRRDPYARRSGASRIDVRGMQGLVFPRRSNHCDAKRIRPAHGSDCPHRTAAPDALR